MAEDLAKIKQYKYQTNANLVITRQDNLSRENGPTGESGPLSQFTEDVLHREMGSRVQHRRPDDLMVKHKETQRQKEQDQIESEKIIKKSFSQHDGNVLEAEIDVSYKPQTKESIAAYEILIKFVERKFGSQPSKIMRSFSHEILTVCKDESIAGGPKKRSELNKIFMSYAQFSEDDLGQVMKISRAITDFGRSDLNIDESAARLGDAGVPVRFNEDEERAYDYEIEERDSGEDSADDQITSMEDPDRLRREELRKTQSSQQLGTTMIIDDGDQAMPPDDMDVDEDAQASPNAGNDPSNQTNGAAGADVEGSAADRDRGSRRADLNLVKKQEIDPKDVDAHWLQREVRRHFPDEDDHLTLTQKLLTALEQGDKRTVEHDIVELLGYTDWEFSKKILRNKDVIVWCTKLKRAKTEDERKELTDFMWNEPKLCKILEELETTHGTAEAKAKQIRRTLYDEATRLKQKSKDDGSSATQMTDYSDAAEWSKSRKKMDLDLEALQFRQGGHFMSNQEWKLRQGSKYFNKKGYQEIHVPYVRAPHKDMKIIDIASLPEWAQKAFTDTDPDDENKIVKLASLNLIQSQCFECAFHSSENMLLAAPTGAGKTNVAMLTILREIGTHLNPDGSVRGDEFKVVYVAPMKSLVREVVLKFGQRLAPFGIQVAELSGDQQLSKEQLADTQVIVTTPEKWDVITRKGMDRSYASLVKLIILDEIHLLHDTRGPVLECLVARTVRQIETTQEMIRLVGLSATLPNYEDVAAFLRVNLGKGLFVFDSSYRPLPLTQRFAGVTLKKPIRQYQLMNDLCFEYAMEQVRKQQQVIVFVHSRKETANTARMLLSKVKDSDELHVVLPEDSADYELLKEEATNVHDDNLRELLPTGFAIHHAGMKRSDRALVEDLFRAKAIKVLCSTATLAWGVNMPAHAVIIKGTQIYNPVKGKWCELSMLDILQMFGRAGRPPYDKYGEAYMITTHPELKYYMPLLNDQLPIESQLITTLPDSLNAEIVLGTVQNLKEATTWLRYTYLFVRMLRSPQVYGVSQSQLAGDKLLEQRRLDLAHTAAATLDKCNLIKYDRKSGNFQSTDLGRVAAHYYISHETIMTYNKSLFPTMSDIEIFRLFSLSGEFRYMNVREGEKEELSKLLDKVPIPIKESIEEPSSKINVLLQAYISRLSLDGFAMVSDMVYVTQSAGRLMRALFEITLKRGWAVVANRCLQLCKMIDHRMWSIESPLRQFNKRGLEHHSLPATVIQRIEKSILPWDRYFHLRPEDIGELIRMPQLGKDVYRMVHFIPKLDLRGQVQPITRTVVKVELTIQGDFKWNDDFHGNSEEFWIIVEDVDGETILHYEYFVLRSQFVEQEHTLSFTIPIHDPLPPQYFIRVTSDKWLGSETVLPISFRHLILPEKYRPPTELLDLQPLPSSSLQLDNMKLIDYVFPFKFLNAIQTQVFSALYRSDDNMLLCAPTNSGKSVCADIAILKMISEYPNGKCVYIEPIKALAEARYAQLVYTFGQNPHLEEPCPVVNLSGDTQKDVKALNHGRIIVTTPEHWDNMSRRWRSRRSVQSVNLLIVDNLHLIGGDNGSTLEMVVSRMRYIKEENQIPLRIIGLGVSVANAKDLGDWIDAPVKNQFNFSPTVRPVRHDIHIQGSDINNFESRQIAFTKPCYLYITRYAPKDRVIVFVPSRKHCRRVASDIVALAASEGNPTRFLHIAQQDFTPYLQKVKKEGLRKCLSHGVGFIHAHTADKERLLISRAFKTAAIQILVIEQSLCWMLETLNNPNPNTRHSRFGASMVIVMDTQYYSGLYHTYVDYPLANIIQMMGKANIPGSGGAARAVILCHSSKKQYFRKFLMEPFPVESHLDCELENHINAEIVSTTIRDANDAIDLLTWSFYYHRLTQNPNYYSLRGVSDTQLSQHLSELVEECFQNLFNANCIQVDAEMEVTTLNNGLISSYYYIDYRTVERFCMSLTEKGKLATIIDVLSYATEFETIPIRNNEERALEKLARHLPLRIEQPRFTEVPTKVNILLQTHFLRQRLAFDVSRDRDTVLTQSIDLLYAMVDVLSTSMWLKPALEAIELCQMITQAMWDDDSQLLQLPHISRSQAKICKEKYNISDIIELAEMEDSDRLAMFKEMNITTNAQISEISEVCNLFPELDVNYQLLNDGDSIQCGDDMKLLVQIDREDDDDGDDDDDESMTAEEMQTKMQNKIKQQIPIPMVHCPLYPKEKTETWFLVVGDQKRNKLLSVKRFSFTTALKSVQLPFKAPDNAGDYEYKLYLLSDSYLGCDVEYNFKFTVKPLDKTKADAMDEDTDEDDSQ